MKIYAIQRGCYSDKKIVTCTIDYEKALKIKKIYDEIDDCVVILTFENEQEIILPLFCVFITNGILEQEYTTEAHCDDEECEYHYSNNEHEYCVRAESKQQAEKIALDKFYMWKAEKENLV